MDEKTAKADDTLLALVRSQFEEWYEGTKQARATAEKCRDYRDGKQWTSAESDVLKARGQPTLVDNKIADKCDALLGIERQMRTDPKAFPRTPKHEQDAEAATDALRYVADDNNFQRSVRQRCADNLMVEGMTAVEIEIEKYKGRDLPKICQRHIPWDRTFYDIRSMLPDFSDKRYCGFFTWMDDDAALERWPKCEDAIEASAVDDGTMTGTTEDKPLYVMTVGKRKRLRVNTHFFIHEGIWKRSVWCLGGWLEEAAPCTYKDENGEHECPIELQLVYRDRDGCPYGPTKNWLDRQDEVNKRKSKMMHLLNSKQLFAPKGAFPDDPNTGESGIKIARDQLHKPDGYVEYVDGFADKIDVRDNLTMAEGQWRLLVHSIDSLSTTGPNAALLGQTGSVSGLAKQVDQQAGTLTVAPLFEALAALQLRIYRQTWNRIRQFWTAETWIRVTDDEQNVKFVPLNQQQYNGDLAAEELKESDYSDDEKEQMIAMIAADPRSRQKAMTEDGKPLIKHNVAEMDVDIILDESPDVVTVQQEEFGKIVEIAKAYGPQAVPFEVVLELSQFRSTTKKRVMDKLSGNDNPMAQQMAKMQQILEELAARQAAADVRKTESEAAKNEAAVAETQVDSAVKVASFIEPPQPATKTQVSVN